MRKLTALYIFLFTLLFLFNGCSDDKAYFKLTGRWEGKNTNDSTGKQWDFRLTIEHRGKEITGIYTDYRGGRTLRNVTYDGDTIGFIIDLWPEVVTYYGVLSSEDSMGGTWSYSGDDNNGSWYLVKNRDPDEDAEDDENDDDQDSTNQRFSTSFFARN
jgi:hypothetical protein